MKKLLSNTIIEEWGKDLWGLLYFWGASVWVGMMVYNGFLAPKFGLPDLSFFEAAGVKLIIISFSQYSD